MNRIPFLILFGLYCSCTSPNEIVGTWVASEYSIWEQGIAYLKGTRGAVKGKEIIFNYDMTYMESHKGIIKTGNWHIKNDSLYMTPNDSNNPPDDTINAWHEVVSVNRPQLSYAIKKNKLVKYYSGNYCNQRESDGSIERKDNFMVEILKKR